LSKASFNVSPPKFFSNPWVGFIGTVASVLGVLLAAYFFLEGKENHQLTYYVNPSKAIVVKSGQASNLAVSFNGKIINTDITAAQIILWNQGKLSIKTDDILKPIVIYTENNVPILEATIRKSSRDVTQLSLNTEEIQKGLLTVSWSILEQNDGGIIQLIYAGGPEVNIYARGVIEGQREIIQLKSVASSPSPFRWSNILWYVVMTSFLIGWLLARFKYNNRGKLNMIMIMFIILALVAAFFYDFIFRQPSIPFGS